MENDINVGAVLLIGCYSFYSRDGPIPDQALHRGIQLQQWWVYVFQWRLVRIIAS
jgi:hypothetical protein